MKNSRAQQQHRLVQQCAAAQCCTAVVSSEMWVRENDSNHPHLPNRLVTLANACVKLLDASIFTTLVAFVAHRPQRRDKPAHPTAYLAQRSSALLFKHAESLRLSETR